MIYWLKSGRGAAPYCVICKSGHLLASKYQVQKYQSTRTKVPGTKVLKCQVPKYQVVPIEGIRKTDKAVPYCVICYFKVPSKVYEHPTVPTVQPVPTVQSVHCTHCAHCATMPTMQPVPTVPTVPPAQPNLFEERVSLLLKGVHPCLKHNRLKSTHLSIDEDHHHHFDN